LSLSKVAFSDERCFVTLHPAASGCNLAKMGYNGWRSAETGCSTSRLGAAGHTPSLALDQIALGRRLSDESTSQRTVAKVLRSHHVTLYRALDAAGIHAVEAC